MYHIWQNFRVGKLMRLCTKYTKTFAVHQAMAIMYCTQQVIRRENFCDWLKNRESFPTQKFCHIRYVSIILYDMFYYVHVCILVSVHNKSLHGYHGILFYRCLVDTSSVLIALENGSHGYNGSAYSNMASR